MKAKAFSKAMLYHLQWKVQLRKFLCWRGNFDASEISADGCKFGKWLRSDETTGYAPPLDIQEVERTHAKLHEAAKRVYDLKMLGKDDAALKEFKKMEAISMKLCSLLSTLKIISNAVPGMQSSRKDRR